MAPSQPNILILMADQFAGTLFSGGPAPFLHAPTLRRLASEGVVFGNAYCASPLCAPSRAAFMTGLAPSRTGVYDNAAEFRSQLPTFAHRLRLFGYRTVLSGKMHFVGPDQLHGFEERLTTDIYPADFGWTPDWSRPSERIDWWYHNLGSVTAAGAAEITNQLEYDDEVAFHARAALHRLARRNDARPFLLVASFTHPHDPYVARPRFLDLYPDPPMPAVGPIAYEDQDPHSKRLFDMSDWRNFRVTEKDVRESRRAYFANISYLDELVGGLLDTLAACGFAEDTVVLFLSDHGDMLGERGLWFKMSFYEGSARVPLLVHAPGRFPPRAVGTPVSLLDVAPTLVALAGGDSPDGLDGTDLTPLMQGEGGRAPVVSEYAAEGAVAPMVMVRDGRWKLNLCPADPPQLFDVEADPHELSDLGSDPAYVGMCERLAAIAAAHVDMAAFDAGVRRSQRERLLVYPALRNGAYYPWDHQPLQAASERYMRNHMDLNVVEAVNRWPKGG